MVSQKEPTRLRRTECVVVTSASRGVGVTSVAIHLAAEFATRRTACLLDLDRTWGGASARLGLSDGHRTWADCDGSAETLRSCALPMPGAFRLLAAPSQDDPSAPEAGVIASLAGATFDRVVVDLPADSDHREELSEVTNALLLVVPPTHEGMTRARTAAARRPEDRLGFVANRLGAGSDVPMSELVPVLGCPLVAELPCTPALRDAEDEHRLLARPWSRWARGIKRVSRALESQGTA